MCTGPILGKQQGGKSMNPEKIMNGISKEIGTALKELKKAKTAEEKLIHSKIIKNLCESQGVFLNFMSDIDLYDSDGVYEDAPIPF